MARSTHSGQTSRRLLGHQRHLEHTSFEFQGFMGEI